MSLLDYLASLKLCLPLEARQPRNWDREHVDEKELSSGRMSIRPQLQAPWMVVDNVMADKRPYRKCLLSDMYWQSVQCLELIYVL
jgi:hypothetical protein